jgi:hypothetical protein
MPDEVLYTHRFKHIHLAEEAIIVQDRFGKPLATIPLKGL